MGSDGIYPRVLQELAEASMVFERSEGSGEAPVYWKLANVQIFKKGKRDGPGYRPDDLTLVPVKITEMIILGVTEKHLKDSAVICHNKHRFMRGKSCLTNFISFSNKVTHLVDQGKPVDAIFLDFSKGFVTVSLRILLDKMSR